MIPDIEMLAEQDGRKLGHQEAMQEVLGYLRKEYADYKSMSKTLNSKFYDDCSACVLMIVEDLFGIEEQERLANGE